MMNPSNMESTEAILSKGKKTDLTVEELRSVSGYETISDQDAIRTLYSIKELSTLIFFANSKNNSERK